MGGGLWSWSVAGRRRARALRARRRRPRAGRVRDAGLAPREAERRDGGPWLIADRICVFESTRVFTGKAPPVKPEWTQQQRSQDDPIFKMRREAGIDT